MTPGAHPGPTTVILVRHARSTANSTGVLAGRTPGVLLDETGRRQAAELRDRLVDVPIDRLISSPAERCRHTLEPLAAARGLVIESDDRLAEVDYGGWTGRALRDLAGEPLWRVVQQHPSAAIFPGGEGLAAVATRAISAVRDLLAGAPGPPPTSGTVLVCSHGDVVKAILADALGMHLDSFQRIVVAPASLSVVRYTALRPFVERINDSGDLTALAAREPGPAVTQAADPAGTARSWDPSDAAPGGVPR